MDGGFPDCVKFRQIFEEIISTQPNTINQEQIEQLVNLIIDEDSRLYALTDQYIEGEQIRIDPQGRVAVITTPEFIESIWDNISITLTSKLDEDIRTIIPTLPANYAELGARDKCSYVRTLFVKLDTIHGNLFPGVVSFISHTLQGLFGSFKDEVNLKRITAQTSEIEQLNQRTSKIISKIDNKIKRFARDFVIFNSVRFGKILPEMCYYNDRCRSRDEPDHLLQFIHKNAAEDDDCWFESLQVNEMRTKPGTAKSTHVKGSLHKSQGYLPKSKKGGSTCLIRTKLVRNGKSRRRRTSTKHRTRRRR